MIASKHNLLILTSRPEDEKLFRQLLDNHSGIRNLIIQNTELLKASQFAIDYDIDVILYCAENDRIEETIKILSSLSLQFPVVVILKEESFAIELIKAGADELLFRHNISSSSLYFHIRLACERKCKIKRQINSQNHLINSIIDGATESIFIKDIDGRYLFVNNAVLRLLKKERSEIVGKNDLDLYLEEDALLIIEGDKKVLEKGQILSTYVKIKPFDDVQERIFDATKGPVKDENGNVIGIFGISRDVTDKLLSDKKLVENENKLKLLFENSNDIILLIDNDNIIQFINSSVSRILNWNVEELIGKKFNNLIHALDKKEYTKCLNAVLETPDNKASQTIRLQIKGGEYIYANITLANCNNIDGLNGVIINASDITERIEIENNLQQNVSVLSSTLESTNEGILVVSNDGVMTNFNSSFVKMWEIPDFIINSHDDKAALGFVLSKLKYPNEFLNKVISLYAKPDDFSFDIIELKNGSIFERYSQPQKKDGESIGRVWSFRDITEKHKVHQELLQKDNAILNAISGIGMTDLEGTIVYANTSLAKMWGANSEKELIGLKLIDVFEGERIYQTIHALRERGFDRGEDIGKRLDGSLFTVEFSANVVLDEHGNPTCMFGSFIDITERKRLERSLRESETLFRELAENAPGGIVLLGPDNKYKYGSPSIKRIMGYEPELVIGKDPDEHTHPDDLKFLVPMLLDLIANPQKVFTAQYRFKHANGTWRWVESTFSNLYHVENVNSMVINFQDITERVISENKISELSNVVEQSSVSVIITNVTGEIEYTNPYFTKATGYTAEEVKGKYTSMLKSGDTPKEVYAELWETILRGDVWKNELSNRKKDGTLFWESVTISPVFDKNNTITRFVALKEDITERKKAEVVLKEAYEKEKYLIEHLQNVREEERAKLSREFHDEIGQHLTVLKMDISWLYKKTEKLQDPALTKRLEGLKKLLDDTVKSFRRILSDLRPVLIDDIGLEAAMDAFIKDYGSKNGIATEFVVHLKDEAFPENINLTLYRILQESLNNIHKHAEAKNVFISIKQSDNKVFLTIIDDGKGFDVTQIKSKSSFGIMGMEERIKMIGGEFEISSVPEEGTTLKVSIPLL